MNASLKPVDASQVNGGLTASAVLVDLCVSVWSGRKTDKENTEKVVSDAQATARDAALVTKRLFVGNNKLEAITKQGWAIRAYVEGISLPWMGDLKLLPVARVIEFQQRMGDLTRDFDKLVYDFLSDYRLQVGAMAFKLGALFKKEEYPTATDLQTRFKVAWAITPVPEAGDFRVEAEQTLRENLAKEYQRALNEQLTTAMTAVWGRLKECLEHLSNRLMEQDDGKAQIFRNSLVENAHELLDVLKDLNIANDPALEEARRQLGFAMQGVEAEDLRKNKSVREGVKAQVDSILNGLRW